MTSPLDYTQLSRFQQCPERYRLEFLEGLQRADQGSRELPMKFGAAFHTGLAQWYAQQAHRTSWVTPPQETLYTTEHLEQMFHLYTEQYATDRTQYQVHGVEQLLILALADDVPPYGVKMDAVVEDTQGIWGLETKTTARREGLNDRWWQSFEMSQQVTGQWLAVQQSYGRCDGIIVNAVWFGNRQRASVRGSAGFFVECERQVFSRTAAQVEDWKHRTQHLMRRLVQTQSSGAWEQNTRECVYCPMQPLCLSVGEPGVREAMYTTYDPYAYLEAP